jgi:hypothetical protein
MAELKQGKNAVLRRAVLESKSRQFLVALACLLRLSAFRSCTSCCYHPSGYQEEGAIRESRLYQASCGLR